MSKEAALNRTHDAQARRAASMVRGFAAKAIQTDIKPVRFKARSYDGRMWYRTPLRGWYLKRDRSVGVSVDGQFYVLSAPTRLRSWLTGTDVPAADPPLELGRGGRDGQSIPLADAIEKRLTAGNDWP